MSLKSWAENGWLRPHQSSSEEVSNLLKIVERGLADAKKTAVSDDWRFGIAYNAALKLCTILLYASGFRPEKSLAHYRTLQALPLILGEKRNDDADYLDACRTKRNVVEYDYVGDASTEEVEELIQFVIELREDVLKWLKARHPELLSAKKGKK